LGFFNRAGEQTKSGAASSFGQGQLCSGDRKDFLSAATVGCPRSQPQLGNTTNTGGKPCAFSCRLLRIELAFQNRLARPSPGGLDKTASDQFEVVGMVTNFPPDVPLPHYAPGGLQLPIFSLQQR